MKNNTPPASDPVSPLIWKLILIGGGVLIMVLLVFTTRSIIRVFRSSPSHPDAAQANAETVSPNLPAGVPLSSASDNFGSQISSVSAPDNSKPAASPSSQPTTFTVPAEIMRQREQARIETIEVLKREAQEQAGTSGVPKEVIQQLEQSDPYIQ